jgi:hypothetical protein
MGIILMMASGSSDRHWPLVLFSKSETVVTPWERSKSTISAGALCSTLMLVKMIPRIVQFENAECILGKRSLANFAP